MPEKNTSLTFLFTDIEDSTRLWDEEPLAMRAALARHDALIRACIERHGGSLVKSTGDGVHAAFPDPAEALCASIEFQQELSAPDGKDGDCEAALVLRSRCGLHSGYDEQRGGDYFGSDVNRAARIMQSAHAGQILLSRTVAEALSPALPETWNLLPLGRVRLRGLKAPEDLYQVCAPGLRTCFPAPRNLAKTPHNLPAAFTRFIGREQVLEELETRLGKERLLTLHGLGGLGKTRLSLELAGRVLDRFPDGVWFIELAHLSEPALVPSALARVLGLKEEPERPILDTVAAHVAPLQMLILLDNCEHLVDACAQLAARLLRSGPAVNCLVTSRERLRIAGEVVIDVPPLPAPSMGRVPTLEKLLQIDAVRLFIDRVQAARPGFALEAEQVQCVAQICQRLDGIPLAIELAAACTRTLPLAAVARGLDDRFSLLVQGDRSALPRQQTLRALIDWSHDLLSAQEQDVLHQLSVFAGGWTFESAAAVYRAKDGQTSGRLAADLHTLVEKSLIQVELESGRYSMLDTVRQYAREHLQPDAFACATGERHVQCFLHFAETARAHVGGPEQTYWLQQLDADRDNLLAAFQSCKNQPDGAALGARLITATKHYWISRGLLGMGLRVSTEALMRIGEDQPALACPALFGTGQLCFFAGRYADAQRYLQQALALSRTAGEQRMEAAILQPLGMAYLGLGQVDAACQHLESAVALAQRLGLDQHESYSANALSQLYRVMRRWDDALECNHCAHQMAERRGDSDLAVIALLNEAMIRIDQQRLQPASDLLLEAVERCAFHGSVQLSQSSLEVACALACELGRWPAAWAFLQQAEALAENSGLRRDPADDHFLAPRLKRVREAVQPPRATSMAVCHEWLNDDAFSLSDLADWVRKSAVSGEQLPNASIADTRPCDAS